MRFVFLFLFMIMWPFCLRAADDDMDKDLSIIENESFKDSDEASRIIDDAEEKIREILMDMAPKIDLEAPSPGLTGEIKERPVNRDEKWWWNLVKKGKLNMKDTTVIYPRFIKFCVDVYNWADETFNSYDPNYVEGTGKRWKVRIVSDNWVDSYSMTLPNNLHTWMSSDLYSNIGAYIQYMAVSVGSSYDIGKLFKKHEPSHKKFEFGFNCARFNAELYYNENTGGTYLRKFGKFKNGKIFKEPFPGVQLYDLGFDIYYFFNNRKYSQGAAYNFSKFQKRNQGSFLIGFSYTNLKINFDFDKLPSNLYPYLTIPEDTNYLYHYNSYALIFGYGYNWVIIPRLLFNITAMPSIGASHSFKDSVESDKWMLSMNVGGRMSLTYNLGNYFFCLIGKINGHWFKSGIHSMFSSVENFSANIGLRF